MWNDIKQISVQDLGDCSWSWWKISDPESFEQESIQKRRVKRENDFVETIWTKTEKSRLRYKQNGGTGL